MQLINDLNLQNQVHKILILSATPMEIEPLLQRYTPEIVIEDMLFSKRIGSCSVDFLITGVGLMTSAFAMGTQMARESYDVMLQLGIAGSLNDRQKLGDLVCVASEVIADEGAYRQHQWMSLWDMGLGYKKNGSARLTCPHAVHSRLCGKDVWMENLRAVRAISVNTITTDFQKAALLTNQFDADIETMEGASFFFAAQSVHVPEFLSVRAISNKAGAEREDWDIPLAIDRLNRGAISFLNHFTHDIL